MVSVTLKAIADPESGGFVSVVHHQVLKVLPGGPLRGFVGVTEGSQCDPPDIVWDPQRLSYLVLFEPTYPAGSESEGVSRQCNVIDRDGNIDNMCAHVSN